MKYSCINSTPNIQHLKSVFVFNLERLKRFKRCISNAAHNITSYLLTMHISHETKIRNLCVFIIKTGMIYGLVYSTSNLEEIKSQIIISLLKLRYATTYFYSVHIHIQVLAIFYNYRVCYLQYQ